MTALVLSIVGFLVCPVVCSVLGMILGVQARNRVMRSDGALRGAGLGNAAFWLGAAGLVFWMLLVALTRGSLR